MFGAAQQHAVARHEPHVVAQHVRDAIGLAPAAPRRSSAGRRGATMAVRSPQPRVDGAVEQLGTRNSAAPGYCSSGSSNRSSGHARRGGRLSRANVSTCPTDSSVRVPVRRTQQLAADDRASALRSRPRRCAARGSRGRAARRSRRASRRARRAAARLVDDALRRLGGDHLGHRRLRRRAPVLRRRASMRRDRRAAPRRRCPRPFAEHRAGHVALAERSAEHPARACVRDRLVERTAREADGRGADRRAKDVERAHRELESFAGVAEHRVAGNAAAVELESRERMRRDHFDPLRNREAGVSAGTTNAEMPRAPGSSLVRTNTQ